MARLRWYALTTVGGLFIVWELITEAMSDPSRWDLVAILVVIPMYAVGAWLTWRLPEHPQPVRLLVCGTAVAVGLAGFVGEWPWSPVLSALSLEAAAVALLAMALLIGSFPDGFVERRWQRLALRCSWVILLGAPLALLASPVVPVSSDAAQYRPAIPNPYAVSWLAWLAQPAAWLALHSGWVLLVGVLVLCARFVAADATGRAQMRVIFVVVLGLLLYFAGTVAPALGAPEDSALVVTLITLGSLTVILLPGAISYGILRHRLIDLDLVVRKSVTYGAASVLIAATYALSNRVPVTLAVTVISLPRSLSSPSAGDSNLPSAEGCSATAYSSTSYSRILARRWSRPPNSTSCCLDSRMQYATESVRAGYRFGCATRMVAGWRIQSASPAR